MRKQQKFLHRYGNVEARFERRKMMLALRQAGATYKSIGRQFGLTKERVGIILHQPVKRYTYSVVDGRVVEEQIELL